MENTGDCQFEVLRSVAFFNCDRFKGETEAEGLEFSGFVNSGEKCNLKFQIS